jgi:soluble cytochrome b562
MFLSVALVSAASVLSACGDKPGSVPEVPAEELTASVPELTAVHEFMEPLWHEAFPAKDFGRIQELVPEFEPALAALEAVELPGILQDKVEAWNQGKVSLANTFEELKAAAEAGNEEEMLGYAEAFHMSYEGLVRIISPPLPELEAVHQHLYGLYHYYGPGYDVEKIRDAATKMAAAIPALQAAELPARLSDHQAHFEMAVTDLGETIGSLMATLDDPSKEAVTASIEAVHAAYSEIEGIFTTGSHG